MKHFLIIMSFLSIMPKTVAQKEQKFDKIVDYSIKAARGIRVSSFIARATFVTVMAGALLYNEFTAPEIEVPDIVKDFCQRQMGEKSIAIQMKASKSGHNLSAGLNTLYVPKNGLLMALERQNDLNKRKYFARKPHEKNLIDKEIHQNNKELDLYKGIIDHEKTHIKNHDTIRTPLFYLVAFLCCERSWQYTRGKLENIFRAIPRELNTVKGLAQFSGKWLKYLGLPTIGYTGLFFITRATIRRHIETQADAGVRDDIKVLTAMRDYFYRESQYAPNTLFNTASEWLFSTHPSSLSRAHYFNQRIEKLENNL